MNMILTDNNWLDRYKQTRESR